MIDKLDGTAAQLSNIFTRHSLALSGHIRWIVLILIMAAFGLRLLSLDRQDIWWDEARNIDVALRPVGQIASSPELDIHPPLYFWLLHGWTKVAGVEHGSAPNILAFCTRYFSLFWGTAVVSALFVLARRAGTHLSGLLATLLGALSPFWIAESQEARMYTLSFLLLTVASISLLAIWREEEYSTPLRPLLLLRQSLLFALFGTMALITHYNALFIMAAWFMAWMIRLLWRPNRLIALQSLVLTGGLVLVLSIPFVLTAWRQIDGYENPNLTTPDVATYLLDNFKAYFGGYAFGTAYEPRMGIAWLAIIGALSLGAIAIGALRRDRNNWEYPQSHALYLQLFWLIGGLSLYYIAVLDRGAFNVRYSSFVTPALYAIVGLAVSMWSRAGIWTPVLLGAVVLIPVAPAIQADLYGVSNNREDTAGLAAWLRSETRTGDVIFVDQKYPLQFYYERFVIDVDAEPIGSEAAPARYLFVDINTIDRQLTEWAGKAERLFWVKWFESDTDPRRAVSFLLDQAGVRGGEQLFRGYEVDWWDLQPPNRFELAPNPHAISLSFGRVVETIAMSMPAALVDGERKLPVSVRWRRTAYNDVTEPLKVRVALYDSAGGRLSQIDSRLLNDRHLLPAEWTMEDEPLNVYLLDVPENTPTGDYEVRVLVYDANSMQPLTHYDRLGLEAGVEPILGQVHLAR